MEAKKKKKKEFKVRAHSMNDGSPALIDDREYTAGQPFPAAQVHNYPLVMVQSSGDYLCCHTHFWYCSPPR